MSGFPEKGLTSGEVRETSGEVGGTSGEVRGLSRARGSLTPSQRLAKVVSKSLDIFEIFAEDCFLLRSFRKFLPAGF